MNFPHPKATEIEGDIIKSACEILDFTGDFLLVEMGIYL